MKPEASSAGRASCLPPRGSSNRAVRSLEERSRDMWRVVSLSLTLMACDFPRPADIGPVDGSAQPDDGRIDSGMGPKMCTRTACTGGVLDVCGGSGMVERTEQCALGCFADGSRCNQLVASNGLGPSLDQAEQHGAVTLPAGSVVDTDTGAVTSAGTPLAVASATVAQPGGAMLRVFLAKSWALNDVRIRGALPVAFVSTGEIKVQGVMDGSADADTNGPGARICGSGSGGGGAPVGPHFEPRFADNSGGYPKFLWASNGFGGGGFGTTGGVGGVATVGFETGTAGQVVGNAELVPLRGGCEGGGTMPQNRGAGGGAIQLVSSQAVHLVAGGASSNGVLHVGGGRGVAGFLGADTSPSPVPPYGPGGGGSGGGILIEAPSVVLDDGTALLASGGGAGGYGACNPGPDGVDAAPSAATSQGGACPAGTRPSAAGGGGAITGVGATGANATGGSAGSGGGGLGRIRINTADGRYSAAAGSLLRGVTTAGTVGRR